MPGRQCNAQWALGWHRTPSLLFWASPVSVTFQAQQNHLCDTLQPVTGTSSATLLIVLWMGHCCCRGDSGPRPPSGGSCWCPGPCCSHTQHKHYFTQPNFNASCFWPIYAVVMKCMNKQITNICQACGGISSEQQPPLRQWIFSTWYTICIVYNYVRKNKVVSYSYWRK